MVRTSEGIIVITSGYEVYYGNTKLSGELDGKVNGEYTYNYVISGTDLSKIQIKKIGVEDFSDTHITVPMDIESPVVVVGKRDKNQDFIISISQLKDKKIAVIKDYFYLKEIYKKFPNMNYIEVDNAQIALNGVSLGI